MDEPQILMVDGPLKGELLPWRGAPIQAVDPAKNGPDSPPGLAGKLITYYPHALGKHIIVRVASIHLTASDDDDVWGLLMSDMAKAAMHREQG